MSLRLHYGPTTDGDRIRAFDLGDLIGWTSYGPLARLCRVVSRQNVLDRIGAMRDLYAVMATGLVLLQDPMIRQRLRDARYHQIALPRTDGSKVTILIDQAFAAAEADPAAFNLTYLRTLAAMVVTTVADDLKQLGYTLADTDPDEFHVLRHLRNAAAHGNRFNINSKAPAVVFRELTISPAMNGQPDVFFTHATPSLVMDLVNAVASHI